MLQTATGADATQVSEAALAKSIAGISGSGLVPLPAAALEADLAAYRGSFLEQLPRRSEAATGMETFVFLLNFCWQISGMMFVLLTIF